MISHLATAVEVSQGSYVARSNELVKQQQRHVVIEYIVNTRFNWKTAFVKILLVKIPDYSIRQTFVPYGILLQNFAHI